MPIREIDIPILLKVLRSMQARGAVESAHRLRQYISGVFEFAGAQELVSSDPAEKLGKVILPMPKKRRYPAYTSISKLQGLLTDLEAPSSSATIITKLASRFLSLTMVRPGVLRPVTWAEIEGVDWDGETANDPLRRIPAFRMKLALALKDEEEFEHLIPLSRQAVDVLRQIHRLTGRYRYVFPQAGTCGRRRQRIQSATPIIERGTKAGTFRTDGAQPSPPS